jgi:hypothetical protein
MISLLILIAQFSASSALADGDWGFSSEPLIGSSESGNSQNDKESYQLSGFWGLAGASYKLSSESGLGADLPYKSGSYFGGAFQGKVGADQKSFVRIGVERSSFDFPTSTPVTPSSVQLTRVLATARYGWMTGTGFGFAVGVFGYQREASASSVGVGTGPLITSSVAYGPLFSTQYATSLTKSFSLWSEVEIRLPAFYREFQAKTGFSELLVQSRVQVGVRMQIGPQVDLQGSLRYDLEYFKFGGTASRGATQATESLQMIGVPLEVIVHF